MESFIVFYLLQSVVPRVEAMQDIFLYGWSNFKKDWEKIHDTLASQTPYQLPS